MKHGKNLLALLTVVATIFALASCGSTEVTLESKVWPPPLSALSDDSTQTAQPDQSAQPDQTTQTDTATQPDAVTAPYQRPTSLSQVLTPFYKVDDLLNEAVREGFPGAQLCIMDATGRVLYSGAWGYVKSYNDDGSPIPAEDRTKVTERTMFDLGGTSEVFTAWYAALHLISAGKLELSTRVVDILGREFVDQVILPDVTDVDEYNQIVTWKESITVEDLLRNRTGFAAGPDFHKAELDGKPNPFYNESGTREESRKLIDSLAPVREPRTEHSPSDIDAIILTFVVEKVTGERLDEYLNTLWDQIPGVDYAMFNPLEHSYLPNDFAATEISGNSRFQMVEFPRMRTTTVQGEVHDEVAYYAMEGVSGNAGLFANAESLCRILTTFMEEHRGIGTGEVLISNDVIREMLTPTKLTHPEGTVEFGMPWYLEIAEDGTVLEYWLNGFTRCYAGVLPDFGVAIVYLTNAIHSPVVYTSSTEHDLAHARFAGTTYLVANQGILFQPES